MRIVFMGTPDFSVPILETIITKYDVVLVVTQPDQYNRKKKLIIPPVKECALKHNIPVFQPHKIRNQYHEVIKYEPDLIVTAAYGQIINKELLDYPKYRCINVHGSILPKYRGGAPIQRAIMNGDDETGITIMYMEKKMDSGDTLEIRKIPILDSDNQDSVFKKLSNLACEMILGVIDKLEKGLVQPKKQNEEDVTFAYNLTKDDELIDFNKPARAVFNQIRGLNSNPGAYFVIDDKIMKVYDSAVSEMTHNTTIGKIINISKNSFEISCKNNTVISILEIQPESKKRMFVKDFLNGNGKNIIIKNKIIQGDK